MSGNAAPGRAARWETLLRRGLGAGCGLVLLLLLLVVLAAAATRYLLGAAVFGSEEAALRLFLLLVALGLPLATDGPLVLRFDIGVSLLPAGGRRAAGVLADVFVLGSIAALIVGGSKAAGAVGGVSPALAVPEWLRPAVFAASAGLALLVLFLARLREKRLADVLLSAGIAAFGVALALRFAPPDMPAPSLVAILASLAGLALGAPLAHVMLAGAGLAHAFGGTLAPPALVATALSGLDRFLLLAVPFFLLVGSLLSASGAAAALVRCAASLVGHRRGGLAQTTLLTGTLFSGASGSSIANAAFGARTFQPQLVARGYAPADAGAIVAATSTLDNVIPPSIAFLMLAGATNLSIGRLLVGGFVAGAAMAIALALAIRWKARNTDRQPAASAPERRAAFFGALPAFGLGIVVVAGIRFGLVTTTEAAALAGAYACALALLARVGGRSLARSFVEAGSEAAAIGLLIGASAPLAFLLAVDDAGGMLGELVSAFGESPALVLLAANLVLLFAGLFLDIGVAILLLGPILVPVVAASGIDPVDFGVILVVNLMIHGLTPPVGILVYVVSAATGVPPASLFRAVLPYLGALLAALALLCVGAVLRAAA